jgi:hypothetical protein
MKADKMRLPYALSRLIPGLLLLLLAGVSPSDLSAQTCGFPSPGAAQTGVLNTYYPGVGTWAAGSTHVHVNTTAVLGLGQNIAVGDMLLLIQMQDADINTTNTAAYGALAGTGLNSSGLFEYVVAQNAVTVGSGANVNLNVTGANAGVGPFGTLNAYRSAAATATAGQRTFQVVKVARYANVTLSGVTATPWNGAAGGVVAVDASGTLTLSANTVNVTGQGFRGAPSEQLFGDTGASTDYVTSINFNVNGGKGEGIAGTPDILGAGTGNDGYPNGDRARGAPANAGGGGTDGDPAGNDQNTGGGAGGNGGAGGQGGWGWLNDPTPCPPITDGSKTGGLGGQALAASATRLFLGGGGGQGTRNNDGPSSGGNGGGIVLIRANAVAGTGTITASGVQPPSTANDGGGGGGAGGSIVVVAATGGLGGLTATANGGGGGYANLLSPPAPTPPPTVAGSHHGPGGGGGGGVILLSSNVVAGTSVAGGVSGLTNQCPGSHTAPTLTYGATNGAVGILQTTLTLNSIPGVQICPALTRTSVIGLRVEGGRLEFATGVQRGTLGFNVYALEGDGTRVPLNRSLIAAPAPDTSRPTLYRVETGPVKVDLIEIEEIEVGGRHRVMGPFAAADAGLRESLEEIEVRHADEEVHQTDVARMLTGRRDPALRRAAPRPERRPAWGAPGVKVEVSHAGVVTVPLGQLATHGLPVDHPERLQVTNLGRPVPFRVGDGGIQFRAEELSTDFTGENAYLVTAGTPPPPAVELSRSGFPRVPGMVRVEQDVFFAPFVTQGMDPWVWDFLSTAFPTGPDSFDLPGLVAPAGAVRVQIGLLGATDHRHSVEAQINGVHVGQVAFQGKVPALLVGSVPGSALRAAGNELTLTYHATGATADAPGLAFLDIVDLGVVLEAPTGPAPVDEVVAYDPRLPSLRGADYLIVTHGAFLEPAERIAELKRRDGLHAVVVDVERAYDAFSGGVFEAKAVQALIREAWRQGRLKYVLLVGGDTFDPRNHLGEGLVSYVPSLNGWDGVFGRVPSENAYADVDGDGRPDLAIGRLPVQTVAQAEVMVDKIARQADVVKQLRGRHLIAVEKSGPGDISFRGEGEAAAAQLPPGSQVTWADTADGLTQAQSVLLGSLTAGVQTTHYFGHGGFDRWSNGGLLRAGDAAALSGSGRETVLFTWTCEVQYYQNDGGPTVNEALLFVPQGGTLASVGPVGISDPLLQQQLSRRLYAHFMAGETLGEAMRRAKAEALKANPAMAPVVEGFGLLGDPALRLEDEP